ncbi:hypothetical protein [Thermogutta sp.]|uniref:hypothetical protein n=1 Tax=Thermogutta sp. TaxID=1962930 RepID=UPI00321FA5A2
MGFRWYSGSDRTGRIPRLFSQLVYYMADKMSADELASEVLKLLEEEGDANMRAKMLFEIARQYRMEGDRPRQIEYARRALEQFDPLAANFPSVAEEYADCCFQLLGGLEEEDSDERFVELAPLALAILVWSAKGVVDPTTRDLAGSFLTRGLYLLAEKYKDRTLFGLAYATAAFLLHTPSEGPVPLVVAHACARRLGLRDDAERLLTQIHEIDLSGEYLDLARSDALLYPV